jgi:hypothetical protein
MLETKKLYYAKQLELSYKYRPFDLTLVPSLKKLIVILSIKNFLNSYDYEYKNTKESIIVQVKAFLFLYLSFSQVPFISIRPVKASKMKQGLNDLTQEFLYSLRITIFTFKKAKSFFDFFFFRRICIY